MSDSLATLTVDIFANDKVSAVLSKLDGQLSRSSAGADKAGRAIGEGIGGGAQKAASGALALQAAQARLEAQQGNLAGAADRLRNALSQVSTTTVQTVNAQRQLLTVETQLATGTSALGGHFKSLEGSIGAVGGAVGGLPGQLLSVSSGIGAITAAVGVGVSVVQSFAEAFKFKAELDATTASINAQLKGVRDTSTVYASAAQFANQFKLTQQETTEAIQASIGVMRASKAPVEDILGVLARLQVLSPEQSLQEAALAVKALASGDTTSLVGRFEVSRDKANEMKAAIQGGADAVSVLAGFLDQSGIGMDALAARTTGAMGAMKELAQAQEQLKIAQAEFAQGPGLAILQAQIQVTTGATRVLTGDFATMGQSLAQSAVQFGASSAGASAYFSALQSGQGIVAAQAAGNAAAAATTQMLTQAQTDGGGGAFTYAAAQMTAAEALAQEAEAAAAQTAATYATAEAAVLAAAQQDAQSAATTNLKAQTDAAVSSFLALNPSIDGAGIAAAVAAGKIPALIGQLASLRIAAYSARDAVAALAAQQAINTKVLAVGGVNSPGRSSGGNNDINNVLKLQKANADAAEARADQVRSIGTEQQKVNQAEKDYAAAVKASGAGSAQAINAETRLAQARTSAAKPPKGGGGGGGGSAGTTKLSDQAKLNNSLLASQESYQSKAEDAEQSHLNKLLKIQADFSEKMKKAQSEFGQSQLDSRAGFYDSLGDIEDQGLRQALSAEYEAAFQEADAIAREKGADVGQKFLEAKQAAIQAQGQRASEIAEATKEGDKDKAAYLAAVDKMYREAEARKLEAVKNGEGSVVAERDAAIAAEGESYTAAQEKIGTAADQAAARKIAAAERAGQAIDAEGAKLDTLAAKYDAVATAQAGAGTSTGAVSSPTTPTPAEAPTPAPVKAGDIAAAIDGMRSLLSSIENAVNKAGDKVAGAVKAIPRSVT